MHDHLTERFTALDADVSRNVRIAASARVRARGDRRRIGMATTSAVAVGAVAALGTAGVNMVAAGGRAPGDSVGSSTARLKIPANLKLPHEGETGWRGDDNAGIRAVFTGCAAGDPTLTGRADARTATGPGRAAEESHSPTRVTEQLFLFDSDQSAGSALAALVAGVRTCGWIDPAMGQPLSGTHLTGQSPNAELTRIGGIQAGNAVFLIVSTTRGSLMSSVGGDERSLMAARLCTVLNLCQPGPRGGASASPGPFGMFASPQPTGSPGSGGSAGPSGPPVSPQPGTATGTVTTSPDSSSR
jgi:hypothetical protein